MKSIPFICTILLLSIHLCNAQKSPKYLWGKYGGGHTITVDNFGNITAAGSFKDTIVINNQVLISNGDNDIAITQTDDAGNYKWVIQLGGTGRDIPISIVNDNAGYKYLSARYTGTIIIGTTNHISKGNHDLLLMKIDNIGNIIWTKTFGGKSDDFGLNNVAVDKNGNIYMSAIFRLEFDDTLRLEQHEYTGNTHDDIYVMKLDSSGNIQWINHEGSKVQDASYGIAVDDSGNVFNTGWFADTAYFGGNMYVATPNKMYLSKYNNNSTLQFIVTPNTTGGTGLDIAIGKNGSVYWCGQIYNTMIIGNDTLATNNLTAFNIKCDNTCAVIWAKAYASSSSSAQSIAVDEDDNAYVRIVYANASLLKYSSTGDLLWTNEHGPHINPLAIRDISTSTNNGVYITGLYGYNSRKIGPDSLSLASSVMNTEKNIFIAKVGAYATGLINVKKNNDSEIILYPNPNTGNFYLSGNNLAKYKTYDISNSLGQVLYNVTMQKENAYYLTIPQLQSGIYTITLYSEQSVTPIRFQVN